MHKEGGGGNNYEQKQKTKKSKPHFIQYIIAVKLPKYIQYIIAVKLPKYNSMHDNVSGESNMHLTIQSGSGGDGQLEDAAVMQERLLQLKVAEVSLA